MSKKFKITNSSRSEGLPGVMLDLGTTEKGQPRGIIHPGHFAIVDEGDMVDAYFGWQRSGLAEIKQIGASILEEVNKKVEVPTNNIKVSSVIPQDDIDIGDDFDDEPDLAMAVEANLPEEGIVAGSTNKASLMGQDAKAVKTKLDPTNPLLDETAKELDNSKGQFTAKAPQVKNQRGQTIKA